MEVKCLLSIVGFASMMMSLSAECEMANVDYDHCNYTIICDTQPESVYIPICLIDEDNVRFILLDSTLEYLTEDFLSRTNFDTRVREFTALRNSWTNIESSAFRYYSKCTRLDISNNNIVNIKNEAFRNLNSLLSLNVSNNKIETLYPESFLISNNVLQELDLSSNKLIKLSSELNELSSLKRLHLQNNMLTNLADDAFNNVNNLNYLNLRNNHLNFLNLALTNLKLLKTLDISHNNLLKLSGYEINSLVAIVDFNASHNNLASVESNCFNQAFSLQKVDFSYNNITINIENVMFINNSQLFFLDFSNNSVIGIQENSFQHCSLYYINFENNNISGYIQEYTLTGLRHITKLDLSRQHINGIRNKAFVNMERLTYLNLSTNDIRVIENSSFVNSSITVLDISYNNVSHLHFLKNCLTYLTELYINNNNITVVPKNAFDSQTQIKKLDLSMNRIISIDENSLPLKTLQYLKINDGNNNFNYFKEVILDLSNNNLTYINSVLLKKIDHVHTLDVSRNNITDLPPGTFQYMKNLKWLNFSSNYLTKLRYGSLKGLNQTEILDLSRNKITVLDAEVFYECNELKTLIIDYNRIKTLDIEKLIVVSLKKFRTLSLGNNQISCKKIVRSLKYLNKVYAIKQVILTSIDKVYHEDNVQGIKCVDDENIN